MAEPVLSVCWKNYTSELATEYKTLLENNFLVDCTLSAEGQCLKAHRLILSACSPYFHMLFQEDSGKHPFVIVLNATFETLKAVIDFVYQGETRIPESNLKAFLTLAQSLQIKGLNAFTQDYKNKKQSSNPAANVPQGSSENIQVTSVVHGINASLGSLENYSGQPPHLSGRYSDSVQTNSSVPVEAFTASCENVQSAPSVTHEADRLPGCDEVFEDSEVTIKHEPLYHVFPETRIETSVNVKSYEPGAGNFHKEMDVRTASVCAEEDLNIFSSCSESSLGNMDSSLMPPAQRQLTQLSNEVPSGRDVAERGDSLQPGSLVLKKEHLGDESEDLMDDRDMLVNDTNEADVRMESAYGEQNSDQRSSAEGLPLEEELATQRRSLAGQQSETCPPHTELHFGEHSSPSLDKGADGLPLEEELATQRRSLAGQQSESSPPHTELQSHEGRHAHPGEQTLPSDEGGTASAHSPNASTRKPRRPMRRRFRCEVCQKAFPFLSQLAPHMRVHTGERPYGCDFCKSKFRRQTNLLKHIRTHTGERPYSCEVCGKKLSRRDHLKSHMRKHTGERPYRCDVCGENFRHSASLSYHRRKLVH